ncbi:MAG: ATP synthase F1 subunit delta [bacterium]|jgi:F-type H+-transporting ATPase subunit delta|nr:ATP synthase F1 subunit delta [bacterium]MBK7672954.1 ATP synthase F1 subunit delta [bacterium]MBK7771365.1 ATP synthase F1 subunit delta [bacterium]MBK9472242.1 ATP synthase F1 subunit delta [bacterium]
MRDRKVAGRYAEALLRTAKPAGTLVACAESYAGVLEVMAASRELVIFLDSPQVREQEKKEVLKKVFGPHLEPVLLDFFNLLLDRNRIELLRDIGTVFAELVEADQGLVRVGVVTAIALPADLETKLRDKLAHVTGKSVILDKKVDPAVIGGVRVTLGDRVIDGTVRTNLDRLRKTLATAQVRG